MSPVDERPIRPVSADGSRNLFKGALRSSFKIAQVAEDLSSLLNGLGALALQENGYLRDFEKCRLSEVQAVLPMQAECAVEDERVARLPVFPRGDPGSHSTVPCMPKWMTASAARSF